MLNKVKLNSTSRNLTNGVSLQPIPHLVVKRVSQAVGFSQEVEQANLFKKTKRSMQDFTTQKLQAQQINTNRDMFLDSKSVITPMGF
jgi:hypothetical protein